MNTDESRLVFAAAAALGAHGCPLRHRDTSLRDVDFSEEYELIKAKKSTLSAAQRRRVVHTVERARR